MYYTFCAVLRKRIWVSEIETIALHKAHFV